MKIRLLLSILVYFSCISSGRIGFLHLALLAMLKGKASPCSTQALISTLKETNPEEIPDDKFKDLIHSIAQINSTIAKNEELLLLSFEQFNHTPGFRQTIWPMLIHHKQRTLIKGHMFEIEQALHMSKQGHQITGFNQLVSSGNFCREFDIITNTHLVECKNSQWKSKKRKKKKQIKEQSIIAQLAQSDQQQPYTFLIASRGKIPPGWRSWLHNNKVAFEDTYSSQHYSTNKTCKESKISICSCQV